MTAGAKQKMKRNTNTWVRRLAVVLLVLASASLAGCSGNVGVGLSVGVPIGDHGYMSIGGNRWY
jgi:predicted small secreted protein